MVRQTHQQVQVNIPMDKLRKLAKGGRVQLSASEISSGPQCLTLHHETAKKLASARHAGKGLRIGPLTQEEMHASGSLWSSIKSGFNKYGKPILSGIGDAIAYSNPQLAGLREGVRTITGVGVKTSKAGSPEMKEKMARLRAMKKGSASAGSFRLR
jgi:hypothetical protein